MRKNFSKGVSVLIFFLSSRHVFPLEKHLLTQVWSDSWSFRSIFSDKYHSSIIELVWKDFWNIFIMFVNWTHILCIWNMIYEFSTPIGSCSTIIQNISLNLSVPFLVYWCGIHFHANRLLWYDSLNISPSFKIMTHTLAPSKKELVGSKTCVYFLCFTDKHLVSTLDWPI